MELSLYILFPLTLFTLWFFSSHLSTLFPTLTNKRILLLIAHPDDEAMFFAPTVLALTQPYLGNHVKILCLSSGNADGLGDIRRKELVDSGLHLGLRSANDVLVLDDPRFQDSMTAVWDDKAIASLLAATFAPKMNAKTKVAEKPDASIDVLITFDGSGVSGHPNHVSLFTGAKEFLGQVNARWPGWEQPVKMYVLPSVNVARKYASVMDVPVAILGNLLSRKEGGMFPTPLLFVSGVWQYRRAQDAMTRAHKSQMVWFRWGWIAVSRYMVVNDLQKVTVV